MSNKMKLPVDNRHHAVSKVVALHLLLVALTAVYYMKTGAVFHWMIMVPVFSISTVAGLLHIRKHSIQGATLGSDRIHLTYHDQVIDIPLSHIQSITVALNYYTKLGGRSSVLYKLGLNREYRFGRVIYLEFDKKDKLGNDPVEISTLKERMTSGV